MLTVNSIPPTTIAPPADFPVEWPNLEDAQHHWTRDCEHCPLPITPLFGSVAGATAGPGRERTLPVYEESIIERHDRTINTYNYTRMVPFTGSPAELRAREHRFLEKVTPVALNLEAYWLTEWKPAIQADWEFWAAFNLIGASWSELTAHLDETIERTAHLYEIHYLMGPPMWFAIDAFEQYFCDLFPGKTPLDAHRLLQGFDNKTLQIGRELWNLSRRAATNETLCETLQNCATDQLPQALAHRPEGRALLTEIQNFLQQYGLRSDLWDWGYPSWQDDPIPVYHNLRHYLKSTRDPQVEQLAVATEREAAVKQAQRALQSYPEPVVARFNELLRAAQVALAMTEDHTYYIDFNGFGWVRRVFQEFGRRFVQQARLKRAQHIFCLSLPNVREMITNPDLNLADLSAERQADLQRWAAVRAPAELGTRPAEPLYAYSPEGRRMLKYIGAYTADQAPRSPHSDMLVGQAGSAGKVRARARIIHTLAESHRLQPGEILVTTTTAPPWTPLFLTAAGLVTDAGGLLSHGAVVSREYRIPAVVGTRDATRQIQDGQMIEVDGDQGLVTLL